MFKLQDIRKTRVWQEAARKVWKRGSKKASKKALIRASARRKSGACKAFASKRSLAQRDRRAIGNFDDRGSAPCAAEIPSHNSGRVKWKDVDHG